jgi:hypothetical protein
MKVLTLLFKIDSHLAGFLPRLLLTVVFFPYSVQRISVWFAGYGFIQPLEIR